VQELVYSFEHLLRIEMNTLAWYLIAACLFLAVFEGEGYLYGYGYGGGYGRGYGGGYGYGRGFGFRRPYAGRPFLRGAAFGAGAATGAAIAGRFVGRRKRAAEEFEEEFPLEEHNYGKAMKYLQLAKRFDVDGCLEKTICEIMTRDQDEMSPPIVKLLNVFYDEDRPVFPIPAFVDGYKFLEAGRLGRNTRSMKACEVAYKTCQRDTKKIRQEFKQAREMVESYDDVY